MTNKPILWSELLAQRLEQDPEFRVEWERTAFARAVALAVVGYRADHHLSQRHLAAQLGVAQSVIARLELGEHNPSVDTLRRLAQGLGKRFILSGGPAALADTFTLPAGATVLADVVLSDGSRVLAAAG